MKRTESATRPRVVFVGQGRWCDQLVRGIESPVFEAVSVSAEPARNLAKWRNIRQIMRANIIVRVGFRPGAATRRGKFFDDYVTLFGRKAMHLMYWIGTDVKRFVDDAALPGPPRGVASALKAIRYHLAGSTVLKDELNLAGIHAFTIDFPSFVASPGSTLPVMPVEFTVLSYVPDFRSEFYGGPLLLEIARRRPLMKFVIMGGAGAWAANHPRNVTFAGWVEEPGALYRHASCVVRIPEHDSIGATAAEALLFGRPLLYTLPLRFSCTVSRDASSILSELDRLHALHIGGSLHPDEQAAQWARAEFDPARRFAALTDFLERALAVGGAEC